MKLDRKPIQFQDPSRGRTGPARGRPSADPGARTRGPRRLPPGGTSGGLGAGAAWSPPQHLLNNDMDHTHCRIFRAQACKRPHPSIRCSAHPGASRGILSGARSAERQVSGVWATRKTTLRFIILYTQYPKNYSNTLLNFTPAYRLLEKMVPNLKKNNSLTEFIRIPWRKSTS